MNVFGTKDNDTLFGTQAADYIAGYGGDDTLYGGAGDSLDGGTGNDTFIATEAAEISGGGEDNDTLISDYSQSNDGTGIHLDVNAPGSFEYIKRLGGGHTFLRFNGIEALKVTGTQYNDILDGGMLNATLNGGAGNDALFGQKGVFSGGSGIDTLTANYYTMNVPYGVHLGWNGENTVRRRDNGNIILTHDGIEAFNFIATDNLDYLVGQDGNDIFYGLAQNDILEGGNGNDILDGGTGNDILDGGNGNDQLFDVSGSDILKGGAGDDYLYTVADTKGAFKELYGGQGADTFVIDLKGNVNLGFDFNVAKLGDFVNAITLPENQGPDWKRLGIDVGFSALGAGLGAIPVVGSLAGFWTSLAQTGVNTYLDQEALEAEINAQVAKANQVVKQYGTQDWGTVVPQGSRDIIHIKDFQIGLDNILLPQLPDASHVYQIDLIPGYQGGAFISVRNPGIEQFKNVAFITNNYTDIGITDQKFQEIISELIQGSTIGTFYKTPFIGKDNTPTGEELITASFANDNIKGDEGKDKIFGLYGDDVIQGGDGNDTIYGGYNNNPFYAKYELEYGNDGNDIINGGGGNDILKGESGNDFLNGDVGNDSVDGGVGKDTLVGGAGNDTLIGGAGFDTINGGDGNDLLIDTEGTVDGGAGTDTLRANYSQYDNGGGVHVGYLGQSQIFSRATGTGILGYTNVEKFEITGTKYADILAGGASSDILNSGAGDDELSGGAGNDTLTGGAGFDIIKGGDGNDLLIDTQGSVNGGAGTDTLRADYSQFENGGGVHVGYLGQSQIFSRATGLGILGYTNVEKFEITGTKYADILAGGASSDILKGGAGNDELTGNAGNDNLVGGDGNDILIGGAGNDILTGGLGADKFVFNSLSEGIDVIKDFSSLQGDKIQILGSSFGATSTSQFSFNQTTGALFFNGQQFATLENKPSGFDVSLNMTIV